MEYARKMIVVPQELLDRLQSSSSSQENVKNQPTATKRSYKSLDDEMEEILSDKKIHDSEKWKLYNQVLQRFLHKSSINRKPINIPLFGTDDAIPSKRQRQGAFYTNQIEEIVETFSKTYKPKVRNLLRFMLRDESPISWNDNYEVFIDGEKIEGSNLVDLISSLVRMRIVPSPVGWNRVMNVLNKMNVPREYILNQKALSHLRKIELNKSILDKYLDKSNVTRSKEEEEDDEEEEEGAVGGVKKHWSDESEIAKRMDFLNKSKDRLESLKRWEPFNL